MSARRKMAVVWLHVKTEAFLIPKFTRFLLPTVARKVHFYKQVSAIEARV